MSLLGKIFGSFTVIKDEYQRHMAISVRIACIGIAVGMVLFGLGAMVCR